MKPPLVSICVPMYNGEPYLEACLASISAQSFGDFEVVVTDDASTDRSFEIAAGHARRDARFRVRRNPHRLGLVGNWNHCLAASRGEWIKLLFDDDLLESRCLERLLGGCQQGGHRFGFCRRRIIFDAGASPEIRDFFARHQKLMSDLYGAADRYVDAAAFARMSVEHPGWNLVGEPTVTLFHRSVMEEYGFFVPSLIQRCDSEYWTRVGTNAGVMQVAEPLAAFRVHGQSTTSGNFSKREYALRHLDPLVEHYLFLHGRHYAALRKELFRASGKLVNWWRLMYAAHEARQTAAANPAQPEWGEQWRAVAGAYPRLKFLAFAGGWLRKVRSGLAWTGLDRRLKNPGPPPSQPRDAAP